MGQLLIVKKPKIIEMENKIQVEALVTTDTFEKKIWFRYDKKYKDYLVDDRLDGFCVGILYYAMFNNYDIKLEAKISERLYYQLTTYLIPSLSKTLDLFHEIKIFGETTTEEYQDNNAVATGISGGIDSFYTLLKYTRIEQKNYKLTHVIFNDFPLQKKDIKEKKQWIEKNIPRLKNIADDLHLDFIYVENNILSDFSVGIQYHKNVGIFQDEGLCCLIFCSAAMILGKLIKIYYFSATYTFWEYTMIPKPYDVTYYDVLNLSSIETENIRFYSSGGECTRLEKVKYLADFDIIQKYLLVCGTFEENCGRCSKCVITMSELYVLDKLDNFKEIFPVEDFRQNKIYRLASILSKQDSKFEKNIIKELKKRRKSIPIISYLLAPLYKYMRILCNRLRKYTFLRKVYYSLNLDVVRFGRKTKRKDELK